MSRPNFKTLHLPVIYNPHGHYPEEHSFENASFSHSLHFVNCADEVVHVLHQNNLLVPIYSSSEANQRFGEFIIRNVWTFRGKGMMRAVNNHIIETLNGVDGDNEELVCFKDRFENILENGFRENVTVIIDRTIRVEEIYRLKKIYLPTENIILLSGSGHKGVLHPRSNAAAIDRSHYDYVQGTKMSGFFVEIIDNENMTSDRFIYTGRSLLRVSPKTDPQRKSGVYYHTVDDHPVSGETQVVKTRCEFSEAEEKIGLYANQEAALTGGNPELLSKAAIEHAKRETEEERKKADQANRELLFLKEQIEKTKLAREDFYAERKHRRTDDYDNRATARKDSSDILKLAAAAVGGGLAVFGFAKKFF